jgi:hypothetical protein
MTYSVHVPNNNLNGITTTNAIEIRKDIASILTITTEGEIITPKGKIHVDDWINVITVMKQLIMDMSKDENLASKYPYVQEAAHKWLMDELRK